MATFSVYSCSRVAVISERHQLTVFLVCVLVVQAGTRANSAKEIACLMRLANCLYTLLVVLYACIRIVQTCLRHKRLTVSVVGLLLFFVSLLLWLAFAPALKTRDLLHQIAYCLVCFLP